MRTFLIVISIVAGVSCIVYAIDVSGKSRTFALSVTALLFVGMCMMSLTRIDPFMGFWWPILIFIGFALLLSRLPKFIKNDRKQGKIHFYQKCVENGISKCENEKEQQKASLIARDIGLSFTDIQALFQEARGLLQQDTLDNEATKFQEEREQEKKECERLDKYSELFGIQKRIAMLTDERAAVYKCQAFLKMSRKK